MENPTLEQMEAWRDQATERLSLFARSNAIEEPIGIGEECYQLGEDCYKPDGYCLWSNKRVRRHHQI